jgi:tetratricopeptide (TPR) repeat protein
MRLRSWEHPYSSSTRWKKSHTSVEIPRYSQLAPFQYRATGRLSSKDAGSTRMARKQNRFVLISFLAYLAGIGILGYYLNFGDMKTHMAYDMVSTELTRKLEEHPGNVSLALNLAMVYQRMGKEAATMDLYEQIIRWNPQEAVALNNLAWMLLTATNQGLQNPSRALDLARRAVALQPAPQFLDTLAEAFYRNGLVNEAIRTIQEAIHGAKENRAYYESQLQKYRSHRR